MKLFVALLGIFLATTSQPALAQAHATVLSDADQVEVTKLENYLDSLTTLKARFLQTADDGKTAQGTAWLDRPGRMRFEYDKPSKLLLVAGHGIVVFHDGSLDQTSNIPLDQSPLGVLLGEHIKLHGDVMVTDFEHLPGQYVLTLVKSGAVGDGTLTLNFNETPLQLTGWSVVDAQGHETNIRLSQVALGGDFAGSLFTYIDPDFFKQGNDR